MLSGFDRTSGSDSNTQDSSGRFPFLISVSGSPCWSIMCFTSSFGYDEVPFGHIITQYIGNLGSNGITHFADIKFLQLLTGLVFPSVFPPVKKARNCGINPGNKVAERFPFVPYLVRFLLRILRWFYSCVFRGRLSVEITCGLKVSYVSFSGIIRRTQGDK